MEQARPVPGGAVVEWAVHLQRDRGGSACAPIAVTGYLMVRASPAIRRFVRSAGPGWL